MNASTVRVVPSAAWLAWLVPAVFTTEMAGGMGGLLKEQAGVPDGCAASTVMVQVAEDFV